jgi:hypothetical protein
MSRITADSYLKLSLIDYELKPDHCSTTARKALHDLWPKTDGHLAGVIVFQFER